METGVAHLRGAAMVFSLFSLFSTGSCVTTQTPFCKQPLRKLDAVQEERFATVTQLATPVAISFDAKLGSVDGMLCNDSNTLTLARWR